jgi:hypothetical protein
MRAREAGSAATPEKHALAPDNPPRERHMAFQTGIGAER